MAEQRSWQDIFKEARSSLERGDKAKARHLARQVVKLAPKQEAPWLLLAATAKPKASIGYLKQALAINPKSTRAKQALRWANKQEKQVSQSESASAASPVEGTGERTLPRANYRNILAVMALMISLALFMLFRPANFEQSLKAVSAAGSRQLRSMFAAQESSPTPTQESVSITHADLPTKTPLPSPTATSVPPTPTKTPVATNGPEAVEAQNKFRAAVPDYLGEEERWIDINLSTQMVTAFEGDEVVRHFTISSGRASTPTVVGEFRIWVKVRIQDMSGPGYYIRDVPYVMYFYEDYGIHGTYWHNNFGTPMSAGCVNMTIDDSSWMYDFASVGTLVKVHF
jgi:lipoprotein-anchoring transpeptidase ErfK/SrfK